jgi:hypothetical protein
MNTELQNGHLEIIQQMEDKDKFPYLLFCSFENEKIKEIGWERTASAMNILSFLLEYMRNNNVALIEENGNLIFMQRP